MEFWTNEQVAESFHSLLVFPSRDEKKQKTARLEMSSLGTNLNPGQAECVAQVLTTRPWLGSNTDQPKITEATSR